ncbi:hypothetical protein ABEO92_02510 [Geobacillus stearothermophilus]|uniref:hypothetical protein n=1 Tax=Geobacillus stearothermophilus TaxID=1422 RepID=UPI003D19A7D2
MVERRFEKDVVALGGKWASEHFVRKALASRGFSIEHGLKSTVFCAASQALIAKQAGRCHLPANRMPHWNRFHKHIFFFDKI